MYQRIVSCAATPLDMVRGCHVNCIYVQALLRLHLQSMWLFLFGLLGWYIFWASISSWGLEIFSCLQYCFKIIIFINFWIYLLNCMEGWYCREWSIHQFYLNDQMIQYAWCNMWIQRVYHVFFSCPKHQFTKLEKSWLHRVCLHVFQKSMFINIHKNIFL